MLVLPAFGDVWSIWSCWWLYGIHVFTCKATWGGEQSIMDASYGVMQMRAQSGTATGICCYSFLWSVLPQRNRANSISDSRKNKLWSFLQHMINTSLENILSWSCYYALLYKDFLITNCFNAGTLVESWWRSDHRGNQKDYLDRCKWGCLQKRRLAIYWGFLLTPSLCPSLR